MEETQIIFWDWLDEVTKVLKESKQDELKKTFSEIVTELASIEIDTSEAIGLILHGLYHNDMSIDDAKHLIETAIEVNESSDESDDEEDVFWHYYYNSSELDYIEPRMKHVIHTKRPLKPSQVRHKVYEHQKKVRTHGRRHQAIVPRPDEVWEETLSSTAYLARLDYKNYDYTQDLASYLNQYSIEYIDELINKFNTREYIDYLDNRAPGYVKELMYNISLEDIEEYFENLIYQRGYIYVNGEWFDRYEYMEVLFNICRSTM